MKKVFFIIAAIGFMRHAHADGKKDMTMQIDQCKQTYPLAIGNYFRQALCIDVAEMDYAQHEGDIHAIDMTQMRARVRDDVAKLVDDKKIDPRDAALYEKRLMLERKADLIHNDQKIPHRAGL